MTLSDQAATGSADREAVAIALGWRKTQTPIPMAQTNRTTMVVVWVWQSDLTPHTSPPDYQRDLPATLAEIERRGWTYTCASAVGYYCLIFAGSGWAATSEAKGTTIANAAIAALLKALENSDD